jgi:hypothetical protein
MEMRTEVEIRNALAERRKHLSEHLKSEQHNNCKNKEICLGEFMQGDICVFEWVLGLNRYNEK